MPKSKQMTVILFVKSSYFNFILIFFFNSKRSLKLKLHL
jgi:hypothetical protein